MEQIKDIVKIMQSKVYCKKPSYKWICYVLVSMIDFTEQIQHLRINKTNGIIVDFGNFLNKTI